MTVKLVTDSLSDITSDMAGALGITVVPLYVRFGEEVYRPNDFAEVYKNLAKETDEILVIDEHGSDSYRCCQGSPGRSKSG